MKSSTENVRDFRSIWAIHAAVWMLILLAMGPVFFPIDWLFHVFPDSYPVIRRMHGLGPGFKLLWVASGVMAIVSIRLLTRRPMLGLLACCTFAASYALAAMGLWGQFTLGCWAALLTVVLAGIGAFLASRIGDDRRPADV